MFWFNQSTLPQIFRRFSMAISVPFVPEIDHDSLPHRFQVRQSKKYPGPPHQMRDMRGEDYGKEVRDLPPPGCIIRNRCQPATDPSWIRLMMNSSSRGISSCFSFRNKMWSPIASFGFAIVSATVSPGETQPGKVGTPAWNPPSSAL